MTTKQCVKRAIDLLLSAIVLATLAPVMAVLAIRIRVTMGIPFVFRQTRPGLRAETSFAAEISNDAGCERRRRSASSRRRP